MLLLQMSATIGFFMILRSQNFLCSAKYQRRHLHPSSSLFSLGPRITEEKEFCARLSDVLDGRKIPAALEAASCFAQLMPALLDKARTFYKVNLLVALQPRASTQGM